MRARYYNPDIKRFMNADVVAGDISDGRTLNRYAYVNGNPVSYTDPFGLSAEAEEDKGFAHTLLDWIGFIPGPIGVVADVVNTVLYLAEGDYVSAGISILCAVGADLVGKGIKYAYNAAKPTLKAAAKATKQFVKAGVKGTKEIAQSVVGKVTKRLARSTAGNVAEKSLKEVSGEGLEALVSGSAKKGSLKMDLQFFANKADDAVKGAGNTQSFWSRVKTSVTKKIDVNKISYNPNDDVFKRGFNEQSVSYQRTYYAQNGKFNCSQEPIVVYDIGSGNYMMQNGHHRLKAAQDLSLQTIKVDQIIPYSESVKLGITNLPINQIPK